MRTPILLTAALLTLALAACNTPTNPSFDLSRTEARSEVTWMTAYKQPLQRPLLVLSGYGPGDEAHHITKALTEVLTNPTDPYSRTPNIIPVTFITTTTFDGSRDRVIEYLEEHHPSNNPSETVEVDVVAVSMGGLIARHAARPAANPAADAENQDDTPTKRLNIRTLYTIATPHTGAAAAPPLALDRRVRDMRPGSDFLKQLNAEIPLDTYNVVTYTRLDDGIVGEHNTAYNNTPPFWVPNAPLEFSHIQAAKDPRILADLMRRLRGEPHYTTTPPTPLPE